MSGLSNEKLENMNEMFIEFEGNINLTGFKTPNVTNMGRVFIRAKTNNIDFSSFDTRKVTNMDSMFSDSEMEIIDISSFKIDSLEMVKSLFINSTARIIFDTNTLRKSINMFPNCNNLEIVYASPNFDGTQLEDTPGQPNFSDNTKLVGGEGTICSSLEPVSATDDHDYMRIDHGASNPGCFSAKS